MGVASMTSTVIFRLLVNCSLVKLHKCAICEKRVMQIFYDVESEKKFNVLLERAKFYRQMMDDEENWEYYSAALVKLQVKFVDKRPANVKDLIRLVKYWRKTYIPQIGHERLPPSYLLELLTIHAWEKAKCPKKFNIKIGFKAVMELLENHSNLGVSWDDNYSKSILIENRYFQRVFRISLPEN